MLGLREPGILESSEFDRPRGDVPELKDRRDGDSDTSLLESRLARLLGGSAIDTLRTDSELGRTCDEEASSRSFFCCCFVGL